MSEQTNQEPKPSKRPVPPPTQPEKPEKDSSLTQEVKPRSTIEINPGRYNEDIPNPPEEPVHRPEPDEVKKSSQTQNREPYKDQ